MWLGVSDGLASSFVTSSELGKVEPQVASLPELEDDFEPVWRSNSFVSSIGKYINRDLESSSMRRGGNNDDDDENLLAVRVFLIIVDAIRRLDGTKTSHDGGSGSAFSQGLWLSSDQNSDLKQCAAAFERAAKWERHIAELIKARDNNSTLASLLRPRVHELAGELKAFASKPTGSLFIFPAGWTWFGNEHNLVLLVCERVAAVSAEPVCDITVVNCGQGAKQYHPSHDDELPYIMYAPAVTMDSPVPIKLLADAGLCFMLLKHRLHAVMFGTERYFYEVMRVCGACVRV
jgi:hypothetical protein